MYQQEILHGKLWLLMLWIYACINYIKINVERTLLLPFFSKTPRLISFNTFWEYTLKWLPIVNIVTRNTFIGVRLWITYGVHVSKKKLVMRSFLIFGTFHTLVTSEHENAFRIVENPIVTHDCEWWIPVRKGWSCGALMLLSLFTW